jgi:hypothetical protein
MIFVLHKRAVGEDFMDANLPKLAGENLQSADKLLAPGGIPSRILLLLSAAAHEPRLAQFLEGKHVVSWR